MTTREELLTSAAKALIDVIGMAPEAAAGRSAMPPPPDGWPASLKWLSDQSRALLMICPTDREIGATAVARVIDPQADEATKEQRALLTELADRGFLAKSKAGYRRLWPRD